MLVVKTEEIENELEGNLLKLKDIANYYFRITEKLNELDKMNNFIIIIPNKEKREFVSEMIENIDNVFETLKELTSFWLGETINVKEELILGVLLEKNLELYRNNFEEMFPNIESPYIEIEKQIKDIDFFKEIK